MPAVSTGGHFVRAASPKFFNLKTRTPSPPNVKEFSESRVSSTSVSKTVVFSEGAKHVTQTESSHSQIETKSFCASPKESRKLTYAQVARISSPVDANRCASPHPCSSRPHSQSSQPMSDSPKTSDSSSAKSTPNQKSFLEINSDNRNRPKLDPSKNSEQSIQTEQDQKNLIRPLLSIGEGALNVHLLSRGGEYHHPLFCEVFQISQEYESEALLYFCVFGIGKASYEASLHEAMCLFLTIRNDSNPVLLSSGPIKLTSDNCCHIKHLGKHASIGTVLLCLDCGSLFMNNRTAQHSEYRFMLNYWDALACCFLNSLNDKNVIVFSSLFPDRNNSSHSLILDQSIKGYFTPVQTNGHLLRSMFHPSNRSKRKPKIKLLQNFIPDAVIVTDNSKYLCIPLAITIDKDICVEEEVVNFTEDLLNTGNLKRKHLETSVNNVEVPVLENEASLFNFEKGGLENLPFSEGLQQITSPTVSQTNTLETGTETSGEIIKNSFLFTNTPGNSLMFSEAVSIQAAKSVTAVSSSSCENFSHKMVTSQGQMFASEKMAKTLSDGNLCIELQRTEVKKEHILQGKQNESISSSLFNVCDNTDIASNFNELLTKLDSGPVHDISDTSISESTYLPQEKSSQKMSSHVKVKKTKNRKKKSLKSISDDKYGNKEVSITDQADDQTVLVDNVVFDKVSAENLHQFENELNIQPFTHSESSINSMQLYKKFTAKKESKIIKKELINRAINENVIETMNDQVDNNNAIQEMDRGTLKIDEDSSIDVENHAIVLQQGDVQRTDEDYTDRKNQLDLICPTEHTYITHDGQITTKQIKTVKLTMKGLRVVSEEKKLLGLSLPKTVKVPSIKPPYKAKDEQEVSSVSNNEQNTSEDCNLNVLQTPGRINDHLNKNPKDTFASSEVTDKSLINDIKSSVISNHDVIPVENILKQTVQPVCETREEISASTFSLNPYNTAKCDAEKQYVISIDAVPTGRESPFLQFKREKILAEVNKPTQVSHDVNKNQLLSFSDNQESSFDRNINQFESKSDKKVTKNQLTKKAFIKNTVIQEQKTFLSGTTEHIFLTDDAEENIDVTKSHEKCFHLSSELSNSAVSELLIDENVVTNLNITDNDKDLFPAKSTVGKFCDVKPFDLDAVIPNAMPSLSNKENCIREEHLKIDKQFIVSDDNNQHSKVSKFSYEKSEEKLNDIESEAEAVESSVNCDLESKNLLDKTTDETSIPSSTDFAKSSYDGGKKTKKSKKKKKSDVRSTDVSAVLANSDLNQESQCIMSLKSFVNESEINNTIATVEEKVVEGQDVVSGHALQLIKDNSGNNEISSPDFQEEMNKNALPKKSKKSKRSAHKMDVKQETNSDALQAEVLNTVKYHVKMSRENPSDPESSLLCENVFDYKINVPSEAKHQDVVFEADKSKELNQNQIFEAVAKNDEILHRELTPNNESNQCIPSVDELNASFISVHTDSQSILPDEAAISAVHAIESENTIPTPSDSNLTFCKQLSETIPQDSPDVLVENDVTSSNEDLRVENNIADVIDKKSFFYQDNAPSQLKKNKKKKKKKVTFEHDQFSDMKKSFETNEEFKLNNLSNILTTQSIKIDELQDKLLDFDEKERPQSNLSVDGEILPVSGSLVSAKASASFTLDVSPDDKIYDSKANETIKETDNLISSVEKSKKKRNRKKKKKLVDSDSSLLTSCASDPAKYVELDNEISLSKAVDKEIPGIVTDLDVTQKCSIEPELNDYKKIKNERYSELKKQTGAESTYYYQEKTVSESLTASIDLEMEMELAAENLVTNNSQIKSLTSECKIVDSFVEKTKNKKNELCTNMLQPEEMYKSPQLPEMSHSQVVFDEKESVIEENSKEVKSVAQGIVAEVFEKLSVALGDLTKMQNNNSVSSDLLHEKMHLTEHESQFECLTIDKVNQETKKKNSECDSKNIDQTFNVSNIKAFNDESSVTYKQEEIVDNTRCHDDSLKDEFMQLEKKLDKSKKTFLSIEENNHPIQIEYVEDFENKCAVKDPDEENQINEIVVETSDEVFLDVTCDSFKDPVSQKPIYKPLSEITHTSVVTLCKEIHDDQTEVYNIEQNCIEISETYNLKDLNPESSRDKSASPVLSDFCPAVTNIKVNEIIPEKQEGFTKPQNEQLQKFTVESMKETVKRTSMNLPLCNETVIFGMKLNDENEFKSAENLTVEQNDDVALLGSQTSRPLEQSSVQLTNEEEFLSTVQTEIALEKKNSEFSDETRVCLDKSSDNVNSGKLFSENRLNYLQKENLVPTIENVKSNDEIPLDEKHMNISLHRVSVDNQLLIQAKFDKKEARSVAQEIISEVLQKVPDALSKITNGQNNKPTGMNATQIKSSGEDFKKSKIENSVNQEEKAKVLKTEISTEEPAYVKIEENENICLENKNTDSIGNMSQWSTITVSENESQSFNGQIGYPVSQTADLKPLDSDSAYILKEDLKNNLLSEQASYSQENMGVDNDNLNDVDNDNLKVSQLQAIESIKEGTAISDINETEEAIITDIFSENVANAHNLTLERVHDEILRETLPNQTEKETISDDDDGFPKNTCEKQIKSFDYKSSISEADQSSSHLKNKPIASEDLSKDLFCRIDTLAADSNDASDYLQENKLSKFNVIKGESLSAAPQISTNSAIELSEENFADGGDISLSFDVNSRTLELQQFESETSILSGELYVPENVTGMTENECDLVVKTVQILEKVPSFVKQASTISVEKDMPENTVVVSDESNESHELYLTNITKQTGTQSSSAFTDLESQLSEHVMSIYESDKLHEDDILHEENPEKHIIINEADKLGPVVCSNLFSVDNSSEFQKVLLHENMNKFRNILHDLVSYEELVNIPITSSISSNSLENYLKLLQQLESQVLTFESKLQEAENDLTLLQNQITITTEEDLKSLHQQVTYKLEMVGKTLLIKISEIQSLLLISSDNEAQQILQFSPEHSEIQHQNECLNHLMCEQENILMFIQQYFQLCHANVNVGDESDISSSSEIATLQNMFCMSRLQSLPSNQELYLDEMRIHESNKPSLPVACFLPIVETEKIVFAQKLEDILDGLLNIIKDAKKLEEVDEIECCYTQIIQTFCRWIEFIEYWILKVGMLPVDQSCEQCKLIEKELTVIQNHLVKIDELTQNISSALPVKVQSNILNSLSSLQHQIDSTKSLANSSFKQMALCVKENNRIDTELERLDSIFSSSVIKLQHMENSCNTSVSEIKPLKLELENSFNEYENLSSDRLKLSLMWPGCIFKDFDNNLKMNCSLRLRALQVYGKAINTENDLSNYNFSIESLERLCGILEKFLQLNQSITDANELSNISQTLKDSSIFLQVLASLCKENFLKCSPYLHPEAAANFNTLITRANDVYICGKDRITLWHLCLVHINELEKLIHCSVEWLKKEYEDSKNHPCPKQDLPIYITFFKDLQHRIKDHSHQVKRIKDLKDKVNAVVYYQTLSDFIDDYVLQYQEFQENIDARVLSLNLFSKQWSEFESDLKVFQQWLTTSESRLKHIQHQVKSDDDLPTLFDHIRSVLRLESEIKCKEELYDEIRNAVEQCISLNIYQESGVDILNSLNKHWNELIQNTAKLKNQLLSSLSGNTVCELEAQLDQWMTEIHNAYGIHPIQNANCAADLQQLKNELWCWKTETTTMEGICKSLHNQHAEYTVIFSDSLQFMTLKLTSHIEKVQRIINKLMEFEQTSAYLLHIYERIQARIERISESNLKKNSYALLNNLDEIQQYKNELSENEGKLDALKLMIPELSENIDIDAMKNEMLSKYKILEQYNCCIQSAILNTEELAQKNVKLWEKYHHDLDLCHNYCIEQEKVLSLYSGSIFNFQYLEENIPKLKSFFHEIKKNRKLLDDVLDSGNSVKEFADAGIQLELESDFDILQNKWKSLENSFKGVIDSQHMLFNEWSAYSTNFNLLSNWIENIQEILTSFHLNEKFTAEEFNKCLEELSDKTSTLLSLKVDAEKICSNSSLHHLAKKNIEIHYNALCSSMQSVKKVLLYYQEVLNDLLKVKQKESQIQNVQTSLNTVDLVCSGTVPSDKLEMETALLNTEKLLQDMAQHYAYLLYLKDTLIYEEDSNFTLANSVASSILEIKEGISRLSSYYLKLIETIAKNNTFLQNCMLLLQLLRKLQNLHSVDMPVDYLDLVSYLLKTQVMEIYIHSYQIVMQQVIDSDKLNSNVIASRTGAQSMYNACYEFVKKWESIQNTYRKKIIIVKQNIDLWQKYWHHKSSIKSTTKFIRKEIAEKTLLSSSHEQKEEIAWILELKSKLKDNLKAVDLLQKSADKVLEIIKDPVIKKQIQDQISELKCDIEIELEALMSRMAKLNDMANTLDEFTAIFESYQERIASLQLYISESIPSSFEKTRKVLEMVEIEKVENAKTLEVLCGMDIGKIKDDRTNNQFVVAQKITVQKTFCQALSWGLNQYAYSLHKNLDRLPAFDKKHLFLIKWCEKIEGRLKQDSAASPDSAIKKLKNIEEEIILMKPEFDNAVSLGSSLSCDDKMMPPVFEKVASLNLSFSHIEDLRAQRSEALFRIVKVINDLSENSRKLDKFLTAAENSLELSQDIKDLSYEEIQQKFDYIQALLNESNTYSDVATYIESLLKEVSLSHGFNSKCTRNVVQYSQGVLLRWATLKEVASKQILNLENCKCLWDKFLNALEELETWLTCKEKIASEVNYSDPGHTRNTYLVGIAEFEKLNHCFQDEIRVLHSVNAYFHDISQKHFNISSSLKVRVSAANDKWHQSYKRVAEVFEALKKILQAWDDFDQLKEHLLLFLTEIDIKLTEFETIPSFSQSSCQRIEEDFKLHEEEKQRFLDLAKQLMKLSDCSISTIQASVDEVMDYWEKLYKHFLSIMKIHEQTDEKKIILQYSNSKEIESQVLKEEIPDTLERISASDETVLDSLSEGVMKDFNLSSENESCHTKQQTYSEVAAMPLKQDDCRIESPDYIATFVEQAPSSYDTEKGEKSQLEKQNVIHSARSKQKSFDEECIKDLLAALKEAEERMDCLEKVLSEITPSGVDEKNPNYSRLLAACRSSVDVIQHLSQFLFYDVPHESNRCQNDEIKIQSEDLLERWQRIENLALNKESRVADNRKSWENFSKELTGYETWIQKALQDYSSTSCTDSDIEKLTCLLERHKELISQIRAQKKTVLTLNITSQKFLSASTDAAKVEALKQRIKTVNDHWDKLYSIALHCQNKLQTEFLQSSEFRRMFDEMKLWLNESEKRIDEMSQMKEKSDAVLHTQHTEFFALKQQLEVYCNRLETLLEITYNLFLPELDSAENVDMFEAQLAGLQEELKSNLKLSQSLLIKCTEMLKNISSSLGLLQFHEPTSHSQNAVTSVSGAESNLTDRSERCSFLMRVARASFPIQAILLLLLGAAILLPMEEEEISCRLSNNFASSLNPMLRYPDGPPPV